MRNNRAVLRLLAVTLTTALIVLGWTAPPSSAAGGPNLAAGRTATASSANNGYAAANLTDGDQNTYWESTNNTFS